MECRYRLAMGNSRNDARLVSDFAAWAVQQGDSLEPDVIDSLVEFKASYLDSPHPGRWRDGDLTELMLHVFPRKVTADDEWIALAVPTIRAYLRFVDRTGRFTRDSESTLGLLRELDRIDQVFADAMADTSRFGMAKMLFSRMSRDGVDTSDQDAIARWVEGFNSRPYDDRAALTGPPLSPYDDPDDAGDGGSVQPVVVPLPAELADAARRSPLLNQAVALGRWVGNRKVTATGVLRVADARQAMVELGLEPRDKLAERERWAKVRSAREFPALDYLWELSIAVGLLDVGRTTVGPGEGLVAWAEADDDVLDLWTDAFEIVVDIGPAGGVRHLGDEHVVEELNNALAEMYYGGAVVTTEIVEAALIPLLMRLPQATESLVRYFVEAATHRFVDHLLQLGAVAEADGELTGTALLRWALHTSLEVNGTPAPVVYADPAMSAADLADALGSVSPADGRLLWTVWTRQRPPLNAARELLAASSRSTATARVATMTILDEELSEADALTVFTAAADDQALRPHAVSWLVAQGQHVDLTAQDRQFAIVEALACALDSGDDDALLEVFAEPFFDAAMIESLWRSPHPDTAAVLAAVGRLHPDRTVAKAARKAAFKAQSRHAAMPASERP